MIMHFPFPKKEPGNDPVSPDNNNNKMVIAYEHEENIADGGEFLDDGIRMKEQPFKATEKKEEEKEE
jgi:hypothetical protein